MRRLLLLPLALLMADVTVQRGEATIPDTASTVTLTAGTDYTAPSGSAFIRIVNTAKTTDGPDGSAGSDTDDFTARIQNPSNLGTSITFERPGTSGNASVQWEIVESTVTSGGNEFVVRDVQTMELDGTANTFNGTTVSGISNDADVVVFHTGSMVPSANNGNADEYRVTTDWDSANDQPAVTGNSPTGQGNDVSLAVVEFTGANWNVQRVEHAYSSSSTTETETITAVGSLSKAFLHTTFRTSATNLNDAGQECWLSATNEVSFFCEGDVTDADGVAWVIENTQSGGTVDMNVQHVSWTRGNNAAEDTWTETITAVSALADASVMGENGRSAGAGSFTDRQAIGFRLTATDTVTLHNGEGGQTQNGRFSVVEWPTASGGGGTTVTAAWTESVGAEDSEDGAASLAADLEEGAGARDVLEAAATLTGHATFAAGAQDTMDAAARLTANVTETAGARDGGEDVVATLAASIAEGAQAGEEWATTLVATADMQETVGPTDSFDLPSDAITAALTEDTGAADTFAATLTALAHAVEEAGPEASFETTASLTADYLETVGPGDVWTATASLQAGLTESVGADDTLTVPSEAVAAALTAAIEIAAKVAAELNAQAKTSADLDVEARVDGDIETN